MAQEWKLPRPGVQCRQCAREFTHEEAFTAVIVEAPEGFERCDFCTDCGVPEAVTPIGHWIAKRPAPVVKKAQPFDRDAILGFFRTLGDVAEPEKRQFRFVLALLLWRKKVLRFDSADERDGDEVWVFVEPGSSGRHAVPKPELDEDQVERLSAQLEDLLAHGEVADNVDEASAPGSVSDAVVSSTIANGDTTATEERE